MKVNVAIYDENATDSIVNIGSHALHTLGELYTQYRPTLANTSVGHLKAVFGRQQKTVQYTHRNWVWTFTNDVATIYALGSVQGIAWEYNKQTSDQDAVLPLLREIFRRLRNGS